jgi:cytochrome c biogenesis protein CcdA
MTLLSVAFFAGMLTVLAPCVLPLLPVIIGTSISERGKSTPYVVILSLALSIILFTFLLKVSTAFIAVPPEVWMYLSGTILGVFGITLVFPSLWERAPGLQLLSNKSNTLLGKGFSKKSIWGNVLVGASLGPIFATCSPTYFVILASVLPTSFALGTLYLFVYTLGLSLILLLIALLGERCSSRLGWLANPHGWFKRIVGIVFIVLGLMIAFGLEKKLETKILDSGYFDVTRVEYMLLERVEL